MITRLYLMPTQKCNCNCTYCYIPDSERSKNAGYTFMQATVYQFIKEISTHHAENQAEIRFIGGEPYLEFDQITKLSNLFLNEINKGKVIINSNGTLITEDKLKQYNNNNFSRIIHILSLDGTETTHNARRKLKNKENAFKSTLKGIDALQKLDMPVYLNMVLDKYTAENTHKFFDLLKNYLNINKLSVSLLYSPDKENDTNEKYKLLAQVYKYSSDYKILIGGHHRLLLGSKIPEFRCRAGEKTILISGDQKIYACQRFVGREEAEYFTTRHKFSEISCDSCVERSCYSKENLQLGEKLVELYKAKYPEYMEVNEFDRILFGVL